MSLVDHHALAVESISEAERLEDHLGGDAPAVRFMLAEAQVHATLAVADAIQTLAGLFETGRASVTGYEGGRV